MANMASTDTDAEQVYASCPTASWCAPTHPQYRLMTDSLSSIRPSSQRLHMPTVNYDAIYGRPIDSLAHCNGA